jgi:RimJ/RimL family protein N-acetyltransferase
MSADAFWLTTERLALRRFTAADLDWLVGFYSDREVTRFLGGMKDRAKTEDMLNGRILQYYEDHPGLGLWMTVERSTLAPVGFHLLNHIQGETMVQVGYGLHRWAWGRGFATEMAAAVLRYGFVERSLPRIVAIANTANVASQHVLLKIGLKRRGERAFGHSAYASEGPMAYFERDADDWLAERGLRPSSSGSP